MHTYVNSQGNKRRAKSSVLSLFLKVDREDAEVTLGGGLFQAHTVATGKARSPTVESLVRGTNSAEEQLTDRTVPDHVGTDRQGQPDEM